LVRVPKVIAFEIIAQETKASNTDLNKKEEFQDRAKQGRNLVKLSKRLMYSSTKTINGPKNQQ
jgi:hypothetical protein